MSQGIIICANDVSLNGKNKRSIPCKWIDVPRWRMTVLFTSRANGIVNGKIIPFATGWIWFRLISWCFSDYSFATSWIGLDSLTGGFRLVLLPYLYHRSPVLFVWPCTSFAPIRKTKL